MLRDSAGTIAMNEHGFVDSIAYTYMLKYIRIGWVRNGPRCHVEGISVVGGRGEEVG